MATLRTALALLLTSAAAFAQTPSAPVATLQTATQLVVVDVVVQDKNGNPIRGLKPEDFQITEARLPQTLRHFEEHTSSSLKLTGPPVLKMPAGIFTNYTPVAPNGTLNVLLLDALNTPIRDQAFVRLQLQDYVRHADPGTRIAIFGLANRLVLLQGFTSDPATLKDIVDHKLIPRTSFLLDNSPDLDIDATTPGMAQISANLQQFAAEQQALQLRLRSQYTLDAFDSLAHYLASFPGRKNLIWFSGAFPLNILPDPSLADPFSIAQLDPEEFRETTNLLAKAQVAVYPVDARGLMTQPMLEASNSGRQYTRNPGAYAADLGKFNASQAAEHTTMDQMANDTGGHAFYNTNGLAEAVSKAISSGSNYYTLTYSPSTQVHDGSYREIRVHLSPEAAAGNPKLLYRQGYYADTTKPPKQPPPPANATAATQPRNSYAHAAMSRGAPTPQDILFKVRVLPSSTATETTLADGNTPNPAAPIKPPFQRLSIDYAAISTDFTFTAEPTGRHAGEIEFVVYVFDIDGRLLNADGRTYKLNLEPDLYKQFLAGPLQAHLEVSVPTHTETYLRIGIHDIPSNRFGVVEFPTSTISHLPPAAKPTPSPSPANPAPAHPVPSTAPAPPPSPPS